QPLAQPPQRVDAVLDHRRLLSEVFGQNSLRMTRWSPPLQGGAPRRRRRPPSAQSGRAGRRQLKHHALGRYSTMPDSAALAGQGWQDLNPRPTVLETAALPNELHPFERMVE